MIYAFTIIWKYFGIYFQKYKEPWEAAQLKGTWKLTKKTWLFSFWASQITKRRSASHKRKQSGKKVPNGKRELRKKKSENPTGLEGKLFPTFLSYDIFFYFWRMLTLKNFVFTKCNIGPIFLLRSWLRIVGFFNRVQAQRVLILYFCFFFRDNKAHNVHDKDLHYQNPITKPHTR